MPPVPARTLPRAREGLSCLAGWYVRPSVAARLLGLPEGAIGRAAASYQRKAPLMVEVPAEPLVHLPQLHWWAARRYGASLGALARLVAEVQAAQGRGTVEGDADPLP